MITGHLGVACAACGNSGDPLGVMVDSTGRLVCFWCRTPELPLGRNTIGLLPAWEYFATNGDFIELACEECADSIRRGDDMVPGEYWGYETRDGGVQLGALSYPHTYESDYPHACFVCYAYLNTGLSPDGVAYVRENIAPEYWHLWGVTA